MLPVLTVTLNPALDLSSSVASIKPLQKLRCTEPRLHPGGGGINVSRAIKELGGESQAFVAIGGHTGDQLRELLRRTGLSVAYWPLIGETRTSITIMSDENGLPYRFVLPGPTVSPFEAAAILDELTSLIRSRAGYIVASGSLPPGVPNDFYARLCHRTRELGGRFVIDSHGAALRAATDARPYLVRLNHLEAQELIGGDSDVAARNLAKQLVEQQRTEVAIVTVGERGAIVATGERQIEITPPRVNVKSGVGAGDSFVAALVFGLSNGWPLEDAARYGVAAAAAAVTTEATELCRREMVDAFFARIGGQIRPAA
jgi:6-phosphofructokinase 2